MDDFFRMFALDSSWLLSNGQKSPAKQDFLSVKQDDFFTIYPQATLFFAIQ